MNGVYEVINCKSSAVMRRRVARPAEVPLRLEHYDVSTEMLLGIQKMIEHFDPKIFSI